MNATLGCLLTFLLILCSAHPLAAQWTPTGGPEGGYISSLATRGNALFAGSESAIFRSTDHGRAWNPLAGTRTLARIYGVVASGTHLFAKCSAGLYASGDQGETWTMVQSGSFICTFLEDTVLASIGSGRLARTRDLGATWDTVRVDSSMFFQSITTGNGKVYLTARRDSALALSTDAGSTWTVRPHGLPAWWGALTVRDSLLFYNTQRKLYRSSDDGLHWTDCTPPLAPDSLLGGFCLGRNCLLVFPPRGPFRSTDQGGSWMKVGAGNPGFRPAGFTTFNELTDTLFAVNGAGVFASGDSGATWTWRSHGLPQAASAFVTAAAGRSGTPLLFCGTFARELFRSDDLGATWQLASAGLDAGTVQTVAAHDSLLFASTDDRVFRSSDDGLSWTPADSGLPQTAPMSHFTSSGGDVFASSWDADGCYRSTDHGATWVRADNDTVLRYGMSGLGRIGRNLVGGSASCELVYSTDQGRHWKVAQWTKPLQPDYYWPTGFAQIGSRLYASVVPGGSRTQSQVYVSADSGLSWTATSPAMAPAFMLNLLAEGKTLFGCGSSVMRSSDSGATWISVSEGLSGPSLSSIATPTVASAGGFLFAPTDSGVWRRSLTDLIAGVRQPGMSGAASGYTLEQNYPNPFNPSTTVRFSLPHRSHVMLSVFNTLGQKMAELVNGDIGAGAHEVLFDASHLASGVYFYRLQAGSFVEVKKLCLVR